MKKTIFIFFLLFSISTFVFALDKVEINTATLEKLDTIVGIGPSLGQRIIDARPFSSIDDLLKVKGIGEKTLQKIKDQGIVYVEGQTIQPITQTTLSEEKIIETPATSTMLTVYPKGVFLNEILPSPKGADEDNEWIEIYNSNDFEIDLTDWTIKDKEGTITTYSFPKETKMSALGYLVIKRPETKVVLNNTSDGLFLSWPNKEVVDSLTYEKANVNESYNRINNNWEWNQSSTPGAKNITTKNINNAGSKVLPKVEKSGNSNEVDEGLATISQNINQEKINNNPWFLFLTAISLTLISSIIVLFIKHKI